MGGGGGVTCALKYANNFLIEKMGIQNPFHPLAKESLFHCLFNFQSERLGGPLDQIVTVSEHEYSVRLGFFTPSKSVRQIKFCKNKFTKNVASSRT